MLAAVQLLGNQQPVRRVVCAEREGVDALLRLPLRQAAPKITLEAGGGLVALLRRLGEQLQDDLRDRDRDMVHPLGRRHRPSRNMAMDPLHRLGRRKRQCAREHLVKGDAERIEVAARIDRAIHSAGLLRRHVGERAGDGLGRCGRRRSRGSSVARPNPVSRTDPARVVDKDMDRFEVLVDEAALVGLRRAPRQCRSPAAGSAPFRTARRSGGRAARRRGPQAPAWSDRLRARTPAVARPMHRPVRPLDLFVRQTIQAGRRRRLAEGSHSQHGSLCAVGVDTPHPADDTVVVLSQDLDARIHDCTDPISQVRLLVSAIEPVATPGGESA